jgi:hypothetical protein
MYIQNKPFNTTQDLGWTHFLTQSLPPQKIGDPSPLRNDLLIAPLISDASTIFMLPTDSQRMTRKNRSRTTSSKMAASKARRTHFW